MMFLSKGFFPFWPEKLDSACTFTSTKILSRLNARDLGIPLACSSALLITSGDTFISNFLCPMYPKQCENKKSGCLQTEDWRPKTEDYKTKTLAKTLYLTLKHWIQWGLRFVVLAASNYKTKTLAKTLYFTLKHWIQWVFNGVFVLLFCPPQTTKRRPSLKRFILR